MATSNSTKYLRMALAWITSRFLEVLFGALSISAASYVFSFFGDAGFLDRVLGGLGLSVGFLFIGFYVVLTVPISLVPNTLFRTALICSAFFASSFYIKQQVEFDTEFESAYWPLVLVGTFVVSTIELKVSAWIKS